MPFRPAARTRAPARPMERVVDPAGWTAAELAASDDWIYELSAEEVDELRAAVADVRRRGLDILDIGRDAFSLPRLDGALAVFRDEMLEGRGFVLIRGVPVEEFSKAEAAAAFWGIGMRFGQPLSQNGKGHMLGHVKDFGGDYADANVRGYQTNAEMSFHSDQCDYVALLCLHPARRGGASRIASLVTIYNEMLARSPELAEALIGEFHLTRHDEVPPGGPPWYKLPIFSFHQGYFSGRGAGTHVRKAQELPGVPQFTEVQRAAFDAFDAIARELCFDMDFRPGDIQILHSHVTVHNRTTFEDWPEPERKRHLMRLWLGDPAGRPLVPGFRENISGIRVAGTVPCAPVDSFEPA